MFRALTTDRKPLWLIPGLLSLSAPLVALAWLYVFANVWRVNYLPWEAYAALVLAAWVLQVVSRLLTARLRQFTGGRPLAASHRFHRRFAWAFRAAVVIASMTLVMFVVMYLPISIFGYLVIGVLLVIGFWVMSRAGGGGSTEIEYGRNILGGAALAYGTTMVAHVFLPAIGKHDLVVSREFLTFVVLCVVYLCAIDFWEIAAPDASAEDDAPNDLALTLPILILAIASVVFAISGHNQSVRPFYYAILTAGALLHVINRNRRRFSADQLRALADVAMLAPALVFHAYASQ